MKAEPEAGYCSLCEGWHVVATLAKDCEARHELEYQRPTWPAAC